MTDALRTTTAVMSNEQVAVPVESEQVTVVVPMGKSEPGGGVHVTGPHPPVVVGSG